ncbi:hypothetical protein ACFL6I_01770 [candidate division KSB1 bacterium]
MNILSAFTAGIRGVYRFKRYIFLVFLVNLAVALVLGFAFAGVLSDSFGHGLAVENMKESFDGLWYSSFTEQASGLLATFDPSVTGIGAVFNGLDAFLTGNLMSGYTGIIGAGLLYLLLWSFFSGGFIALYAENTEKPSFFQRAAHFFPRFVILAVTAGILYYLIFQFILEWLTDFVDERTRETIDERIHFTYTVVKYGIVWLLVWIVNMLFDYGKIITVMQNRANFFTSPFVALYKALITVFRHFFKTFGLYLTIGLCWIILMLVYWLIVPGAGDSSWIAVFGVFLIGQLYLISRIWVRCLFYAGQTALCGSFLTGPVSGEPEA